MMTNGDRIDKLQIAAKLVLQGNQSKTEDITILGVTKFGNSPHAEMWCQYSSSAGTETYGGLRSDCIIKPVFKDEAEALLFEGVQWFEERKKATESTGEGIVVASEKSGEQTQLAI